MKKRFLLLWCVIIFVIALSTVAGAKKELVELRTTHSTHWNNEDGTITAEIYQNPIHYYQNGKLVEYDSQIYPLEDDSLEGNKGAELLQDPKTYGLKNDGYTHAAANGKFQLYFSANSNRPVRFDVGDGWISFQPVDGKPAKGEVRGHSIYYSGVWDNANLLYVSYNYGLKEVIVLTAPGHPEVFSFRVNLKGLEYRLTEEGTIEFLDEVGVVQASIPKGFMEDAAGAYSENVEIRIEERGNNLTVMLIPDLEWLQAKERQYPILIDPTVCSYDYTDVVKDAYITAYNFASTHGTSDRLEVGMNEPAGSNKVAQHTLIKFDLTNIPTDAVIGEAKASLYLYHEKRDDAATVYVKKIPSTWDESTVCWNNYPKPSAEYYKVYTINAVGEYQFELDPGWVEEWVDNSSINYGFYLYAKDSEENNLKYFYSREAIPKLLRWDFDIPIYGHEPELQPKLSVTYAFAPSTPTNLHIDDIRNTLTVNNVIYTDRSSVKLKWDTPAEGETTGYDVFVNGAKVNSVTSAEYTLALSSEGAYNVQVRALGHYNSQSSLSTTLNLRCDRSVEAVSNLATNARSKAILATWSAPGDPVGIRNYEVATSLTYSGSRTTITTTSALSATIENLTSTSSYYVWVRVYDNLGNSSSWINAQEKSPLPEVTQLSVTSYAGLSYNAPAYSVRLSISNVDAATYVVRRTPGLRGSFTEEIANFTNESFRGDQLSFIDNNRLSKHTMYTYEVITYNKTGDEFTVSTPVSTVIPNIKASVIPAIFDQAQQAVGLQTERIDDQWVYTLMSSSKGFTITIPEVDVEGDDLSFDLYSRDALHPNFTCQNSSGLANLPEGVTEWYLSIAESVNGVEITDPSVDSTDPRARVITHVYRFTIDSIPPLVANNSFELTDEAKVKVVSPLTSRQVHIANIHVQDNPGGVGAKTVYFWNGNTEPLIYQNLAMILSDGNLRPESAEQIEKGELGVMVTLSDIDIENLIFPWLLETSTAKNRTVHMKVEDLTGNISGGSPDYQIFQTVQVDATKPDAPDICSHTHFSDNAKEFITFQWSALDSDNDIASFNGFYCVDGGAAINFTAPATQGTTADSGKTDVEVTSASANRPVTITIKTVDTSGWESEESYTYTAYTLPEVGELILPAGGYDTGLAGHYLQWKLQTTPGVAEYYQLQYKVNGEFAPGCALTPDANGFFTHHDLTAHGRYYYRLVAYNQSGDMEKGAEFLAIVPNSIPTTPVPVLPAGYARGSVNFQFAQSTDYDPQDALTYKVHFGSGENPTTYEEIAPDSSKSDLQHNQTYTWYVSVDDGYGGVAESSKVRFIADTESPVLTVSDFQVPYSTQHSLTVTVADTLSGVEKATYNMFANGEPVGDGDSETEIPLVQTNDGIWTGNLPLNDGRYYVVVKAYDHAGNTSQKGFNIQVDRTAPVLSNLEIAIAPNAGKYYVNNGRLPVQFTAIDSLSKVKGIRYTLSRESETVIGTGGVFVEVTPELQEYELTLTEAREPNVPYYLMVAAEDYAGNSSVVLSAGPIYFDLTEPLVNLTVNQYKVYGNSLYTSSLANLSVTATFSDAESQIVTQEYAIYSVENGANVSSGLTWSSIQNTVLAPGQSYRITAAAMNGARLRKTAQSEVFMFDSTSPVATVFTVPTAELIKGETVLFNLAATDGDSPVTEYRLALGKTTGGTDISSSMEGQSDGWLILNPVSEYYFTVPDLPDGTYYLTFVAVNAAGLTSTPAGKSMVINNNQNRMMVHDQGPYSMVNSQLTGWWSYNGTGLVDHYRYRLIDSTNQPVTDWEDGEFTTVTVANLNLQSGKEYHFEVQAIFESGESSAVARSCGVTIDLSDPIITSVNTPAYTTSANLCFDWVGDDPESGISSVQVALGTNYHFTDVTGGWVTVTGNQLTRDCAGNLLTLITGQSYYVTLRLINGAGREAEIAAERVIIDDTPPIAPVVHDQGNFVNTKQPLQADWVVVSPLEAESSIAAYQWALLEAGEGIEAANWMPGNAMSVNLDEVDYYRNAALSAGRLYYQEHGKTYYFVVKVTNGAGLSAVGWSNGIVADETAPFIPEIVVLNAVNIGAPDNAPAINYINSTENLALWIHSYEDLSTIEHYYYAWGVRENVDELARLIDTEGTILLLHPDIAEGEETVFAGETKNGAEITSSTGHSSAVLLDTSAPKVVNVNGTFSGNRFVFDWGVVPTVSPVAGYEVALVPSTQTNYTWTSVGLNTTYSKDAADYKDGRYKLAVQAYNSAGNYSRLDAIHNEVGVSADVVLDRVAPEITDFTYPAYIADSLKLSISGYDATSNIQKYQYALGSLTNLTAYSDQWIDVTQNTGMAELVVDITSIPDKTTLYAAVRVQDNVNLWSEPEFSQAIIIDRTPPAKPVLSITADHINSTTQISGLSFSSTDAESSITHYCLGLAAAENGPWIFEGEATPVEHFDGTLTGVTLMNGQTYYVVMKTKNAAGVWSESGYSVAVSIDTSEPGLSFEEGEETIILNQIPLDIKFTLTEKATVEFTLTSFNGSTEIWTGTYESGDNYYTFNNAVRGVYTLSAQVVDLAGNQATEEPEQEIRYNKAPEIALPPVIYTTPGKPVTFTTVLVSDPENDLPLIYLWDPGDNTASVNGESPEHIYSTTGTYTLTLTVTDASEGSAVASTEVRVVNTTSGALFSNETWSGEHHIYGDVTVPAEYTLTILPGTTVVVDGSPIAGFNHQLIVNGTLQILGGTEQVTFGSVTGTVGAWKGIWLAGTANIDGLSVEHALRGVTVISSAVVTITNSTFNNNRVGVHAYGGSPSLTNALFTTNQIYGIKEDLGAAPVVINCSFSGNGIHYYDEDLSRITISELNEMPGNSGNLEESIGGEGI